MALIELNLEKPALKRTELVGGATDEHDLGGTDDRSAEQVDEIDTEESFEDVDVEAEAETETETKSSSRGRRFARRAAVAGAMTGAALAARKMRARRKQAASQTEVDEDWQTASS